MGDTDTRHTENKDTKKDMTVFEAAEYIFGEMRPSTDEENELYREMLERMSIPIEDGDNIFDMTDKDNQKDESEDNPLLDDKLP